MAAQQYTIPTENAADKDGSDINGGWAPGVGSVPLGAGTVQTSNEGTMGPVSYAAQLSESGGVAYVSVTAASTALVKSGAGRLAKVIVIATGSAAVSIYDNTTGSGTIILTIPANATTGTVYDVLVPVKTGIFVAGTTNTPALLATFW